MVEMTYIYVTPFFPGPKKWEGAYSLDFVKALKSARPNMRVEVFVPGCDGNYDIEGIQVHCFVEKRLRGGVFPFLFRRTNEENFLSAVKNVIPNINDVVVCHGNTARFLIYPLAVKRLNPNCKTLLHHHDLASFGLNNGFLRWCALYNTYLFIQMRLLHEQIDYHVFISKASMCSFLRAPDTAWTVYDDYKTQMRGPRFWKCRRVKIQKGIVVNNGVDRSLFYKLPGGSHKSDNDKVVIGCVGNFDVLKDQITLLKAARLLIKRRYEIKLIFVGSGKKLNECVRYAQSNNIDADFRKEVRHERLPSIYREFDLFVLPSYFEGFGCVLTEAWSCGVPFITCSGQGIEDVMNDEEKNAWLVPPKSPEILAEKIAYFIDNRAVQHLNGPISFEAIIPKFLNEINI